MTIKRTKTVNVALNENTHKKLQELSQRFHLGIAETTELIVKNGITNIIDIYILKLKRQISQLEDLKE